MIPTNPDENDPTPFDPSTVQQRVGLAKALTGVTQVGPTTFDLRFSLLVENLSAAVPATNVQVTDNLADTFPSAVSISVVGPVEVGGGLSLASGEFDGTSNTQLLSGNEALAPGAVATITWTTRVDLGVKSGNFENTALLTSARTPGGVPVAEDLSDDGTTPDANGNGRADDPDEDDPTPIIIDGDAVVVGAAKAIAAVEQLAVDQFAITYRFVLQNLSTVDAPNVQLTDPLADAFATATAIAVTAGPTVTGALSEANASFDGDTDNRLLSGRETLTGGATAVIELTVEVNTGGAAGPFRNQAFATTAPTPDGTPTSTDPSDEGNDPDPNGNGNPNEPGENDPTSFDPQAFVLSLGLAKALTGITQVGPTTFELSFSLIAENLSATRAAPNVQITDDLAAAFPGALSISVSEPVVVTGGLAAPNQGFDGTSDQRLLAGDETLAPGATATIAWAVRVDLGTNAGDFENSAELTSAPTPGGPPTARDRSDNGTTPDSNGNGRANDPGEDDPTPIAIDGALPSVGAAKTIRGISQIAANRFSIAYRFVVENLGTFDAPNLQLSDELANAFAGVESFRITAGPTVTGGLTRASSTFDGAGEPQLLSGDETLAAGATATIDLTLEVDTGTAVGPFRNQAVVSTAFTPGGPPVAQDPSDDGDDPDPNGNGNPDEPGENDPTVFDPEQSALRLGLAKALTGVTQVGPTAFDLTFSLIAENLSAVQAAPNAQVNDDLAAAFPDAVSIIVTEPVTVLGGLTAANTDFDGISDTRLLAGDETLAAGATATITWTVRVDLGVNAGTFENSAVLTSAPTPGGVPSARDLSDDGTTPDSNGNGRADDPGEDDPTPIRIDGNVATVGAAKIIQSIDQLAPTRFAISYRFILENFSAIDAPNVQLNDDLGSAFGGVRTLTVTAGPTVEGGLSSANGNFDGAGDTRLLSGNETLAAGASATVAVTLEVDTGGEAGPFSNQALVTTALTPDGTPTSQDPSDDGDDPDPNGNGNPNEPGENDPTVFDPESVALRIGLAKALTGVTQVGPNTFELSFSLLAENLSSSQPAPNVQVRDDLAAAFPAALSIAVTEPVSVTGALTAPNAGFDGTSDTRLLAGNETLVAGATATITWTVRVDLGVSAGAFENAAEITTAPTPGGAPTARDLSDDGTTPDSNGNGRADDADEDDPTPIVINGSAVTVGAAKALAAVEQLEANRFALTYRFVIENLSSVPAPNVQLSDSLADAFADATAVTVTAGPTVTGALSEANTAFDGDADSRLLSGTETLPAGASASIELTLEVATGGAVGPFSNQAFATSAPTPDGPPSSIDPSHDGSDPDPNGNGNPNEAGENDPTAFDPGNVADTPRAGQSVNRRCAGWAHNVRSELYACRGEPQCNAGGTERTGKRRSGRHLPERREHHYRGTGSRERRPGSGKQQLQRHVRHAAAGR